MGECSRRKEQALARVKQILDLKSPKSRTGLEKQSVYSTGEGRKPGPQGSFREKRLERACLTQVPSMTLPCRIPSSGGACSEGRVDSEEGMQGTMGFVSLELRLLTSLMTNSIFPKGLMASHLFPPLVYPHLAMFCPGCCKERCYRWSETV